MDDFMINRVDQDGRSIYLTDRPAQTHAVIFSGSPGMGKSYLLQHTADQAKQAGNLVIKIDASSQESLQSRMTRAIGDQLDQLGEQTPFGARGLLRKLRKTLDTMLSNRFDIQNAISGSLSWWSPLRLAFNHGSDQQFERPPSSVNDLADRLADLAQSQDQHVVLLIDNLDRAQDADLATINELAGHLQQHGRNVQLVMGASQPALDNLLSAASPDGVTTDTAQSYDVRICEPISDDELRPALTSRVARSGSAISAEAADKLVEEAAGDPGRMLRLADRAIDLADHRSGISVDTATTAIDRLRRGDSWLHHASWSNLSGRAKAILAETAASPAGTNFADLNRDLDPDEWAVRDAARNELAGAGLIRDSAGHLTVADPGLRQWVVDHSGSQPLLQAQGLQAQEKRAQTTVSVKDTTPGKDTAAAKVAATGTDTAAGKAQTAVSVPGASKTTPGKTSATKTSATKTISKPSGTKSTPTKPKKAAQKSVTKPSSSTKRSSSAKKTTRATKATATANRVRPSDLQSQTSPLMRAVVRQRVAGQRVAGQRVDRASNGLNGRAS